MKPSSLLSIIFVGAAACSCSHVHVSTDYDAALCEELSLRIERHDSITQDDYARMIGQNEAILKYLVDETKQVSELPDSLRNEAWRSLTNNPEYLERFGYMFTLGSALYSAQIEDRLDKSNQKAYEALDDYNTSLAEYSDRF